MQELKKWTPCEVTWMDAHVDWTAHDSLAYVANFPGCKRKTLGYYLGDKDGYTFIAESDDRLALGDGSDCEAITAIYTTMIVSLTPLVPARKVATVAASE